MFVKNTGAKIIGFGTEYLVPGDSGELPKGYGETHPTIKYYIAKGWLTVINEKVDKPAEPKKDKAEKTAKDKETAV